MIDLRQLRYFVACAQTGSFSRAAEQLFTTQPSVSKVIRSMEEEIGQPLFERLARGIVMTPEGEHVYKYACQILKSMDRLQKVEDVELQEKLQYSTTPSSWMADVFMEFYHLHQKEKIHYQIYSTGIKEIVHRVQERTDELGFLYIISNQLTPFQYFLSRNYLEFMQLRETDVVLYPGGMHPWHEDKNCNMDFSNMRLIQRFADEFSPDNYWNIVDANGDMAADAETVVTTNSDYIMDRMLKNGDLVNISGEYLAGMPTTPHEGKILEGDAGQKILFGYVKRRGEELTGRAQEFVNYVRERLNKN